MPAVNFLFQYYTIQSLQPVTDILDAAYKHPTIGHKSVCHGHLNRLKLHSHSYQCGLGGDIYSEIDSPAFDLLSKSWKKTLLKAIQEFSQRIS